MTRRRNRVTTTAVLAACLLAVVLTACGGGGGGDARHAAMTAPTGRWVLDLGASKSPDFGFPVTVDATFADGRVSGIGGCNRYNADVTTTAGGGLTVGEIVTTKMMCTPENQGVESDYLRRLAAAESFSVDAGTLTITNTEGADLVLRR